MELSKEEALDFFKTFYRGEHHFPSELKPAGRGWCMEHPGDLATYDFANLTILVVMAHDQCLRVGIQYSSKYGCIKIMLHKRRREGSTMERHPELESAIQVARETIATSQKLNTTP